MRKRRGILVGAVLSLLAVGALVPLTVLAGGPPSDATVLFGVDGVGSPFPRSHDESDESKDRLQPGTSVISVDGEVWFDNAGGRHQVAIYDAGITPEDITITGPGPWVNDGADRLALGNESEDLTYQFTEPGRYLVICNFAPHFDGREMYGFVIVK